MDYWGFPGTGEQEGSAPGQGHSNTSQPPSNDSFQQSCRRHRQEEKSAKPKHGQGSIPHDGLRNKALPRQVQPQPVCRSHMGGGRAWAPGRARVPTPSFPTHPQHGLGEAGQGAGRGVCVCPSVCVCVHACASVCAGTGVCGCGGGGVFLCSEATLIPPKK